jgi:hypothetical protein
MYLIKMQEVRANEKIFFFFNETYADSNLTFHEMQMILDTMSGSNRPVIIHIESKDWL